MFIDGNIGYVGRGQKIVDDDPAPVLSVEEKPQTIQFGEKQVTLENGYLDDVESSFYSSVIPDELYAQLKTIAESYPVDNFLHPSDRLLRQMIRKNAVDVDMSIKLQKGDRAYELLLCAKDKTEQYQSHFSQKAPKLCYNFFELNQDQTNELRMILERRVLETIQPLRQQIIDKRNAELADVLSAYTEHDIRVEE